MKVIAYRTDDDKRFDKQDEWLRRIIPGEVMKLYY